MSTTMWDGQIRACKQDLPLLVRCLVGHTLSYDAVARC